jgi:predicted dehydrogenase/threonine dehydrogenase-like Zn-dependent dehydrogenase
MAAFLNRSKPNSMQQLTQKLKTGQMHVIDVPVPNLQPGTVLVWNYYSVISAGTESGTVKAARKGYLGKALEKPQQVKQVIDSLKTQGPLQTYRAVMKKLDAWSPLGYSCVGEIVDLAPDVHDLIIGDYVACGGSAASHAEVVAVPKNLCAKLPFQGQTGGRNQGSGIKSEESRNRGQNTAAFDEYLKQAAYNTLGAIALQGIRQADLRLGETCAVIGLGLLGQLTTIMLEGSGVIPIGVDVDPAMVEFASAHDLAHVFLREDPGIEAKIRDCTGGMGCDAVVITAGSESLDPINFAGAIARKRGMIVVVGAVPTGFDRDPHFYKKELTIRMSCSYGPGRYDPGYEEKGRDYPAGYVRWTENRNMQAFQELIYREKINISHLTTHVFKLEEAPAAYDLILEKTEPYVGILIEYERGKELKKERVVTGTARTSGRAVSSVAVGFIGAGSYAQSHLLPNLPGDGAISRKGVMTTSPASARSVAERFGFAFCTAREEDIINNPEINTVFIATRHDSHAQYVIKALKAGKNVFVEKPLCIREDELEEIRRAWEEACIGEGRQPLLMVGFNRRFSPLTGMIREKLSMPPLSMIYRVNAGFIPQDSWVQDREIGGGRIIGEVCHFVDYLTFINGSLPVSIYAAAMPDAQNTLDTLAITLKHGNGSVGSIQYYANGSKRLAKEYIEIYGHGVTAVMHDFKKLVVYGRGRPFKKTLLTQDKGQKAEVKAFLDAVRQGGAAPIPIAEIFSATDVTFKIMESLRTGQVIAL